MSDLIPEFHVVEHGPHDAVPAVILHGWSVDHRLMTGCLEPLWTRADHSTPAIRRIYLDLPGMGRTPGGACSSVVDVLDACAAWIDSRLGQKPFLLIGESFGGYLTQAYLARHAGRVLGAMLLCPAVVPHASKRCVSERQVFSTDDAFLASLTAAQRDELAYCAIEHTAEAWKLHTRDVAPGLALADWDAMDRIVHGPRHHARYRAEEGFAQFGHCTTELPSITPSTPFDKPTLWIMGRQDASVGWSDQLAMQQHYPRATVVVMDRAGHNAQLDRPELFTALVCDWLDRVAREAPDSRR